MIYIVVDNDKGTETACTTLQNARYRALNVKRGEILRVKLNHDLSSAELRCALYNHSNYAAETSVTAVIENGIARKIVGTASDEDEDADENDDDDD